jgi:hypothetical protein
MDIQPKGLITKEFSVPAWEGERAAIQPVLFDHGTGFFICFRKG